MLTLNITPEDIDALVKDSIMKAGFGKAIQDAVIKALTGYNNPIDECVKRYVAEVASLLIREKFSKQIQSAVLKATEEKVTKELIDNVVDTAMDKMIKSSENR